MTLLQEREADYFENSGAYLTSHLLAAFRKSPLLYQRMLARTATDEDRPTYLVGRAAHALILEGRDAFQEKFAVGGPVNPKTGQPYGATTKAFSEWADTQGKPVLAAKDAARIEQMAASVQSHTLATSLLQSGTAEGVVRTCYAAVDCQARMDWLCVDRGILVDLKTCDDLTWFEADAKRYGYAHQLAFYQALLHWLSIDTLVYLIAVEKKEPFRTGVWKITDQTLDMAHAENEAAIERLKFCKRTNHWPSNYEDCRYLDCV